MVADSQSDPLISALEQCAAEPIHTPGGIQPFAVLLAAQEDGIVIQCSANTACLFGREPRDVLGRNLSALLPSDIDRISKKFATLPTGVVESLERLRCPAGEVPACLHHYLGMQIIEFLSPGGTVPVAGPLPEDGVALAVQSLAASLAEGVATEAFCDEVVARLRELTGYDRVMVYRFDADWNGAVIAEARADFADSYVGQHFPASDIPPQARALYLRTPARVLADAEAEPVPLGSSDARPLDLTFAVSRAMSPVHREYLRNMGVRGTLVASIACEGQLWGVLTCHHNQPLLPSRSWLTLGVAFARLIATQVGMEEGGSRSRSVTSAQRRLRFLPQLLSEYGQLGEGLIDPRTGLMEVLGANGVAVLHRGVWFTRGTTPDRGDLAAFAGWLQSLGSPMFVTNRLGEEIAEFAHLANVSPGVLAMQIPNTLDAWILWFRVEHAETVTWAGDYRKGLTVEGASVRLSPRKSFQTWVAEVRGRSRPWISAELIVAEEVIRPYLLEVMATAYQQQSQLLHRYQQILFEQVHDAVIVTDLDGVVTFWNDGAQRTLGWTTEEMVGRHITERLPVADRPKTLELLRSVQAGSIFAGRYHDTHKDGRAVWLDIRLCRIRDEAGKPIGIMGASRDVTDLRQARDALGASEDRLRAITDNIPDGTVYRYVLEPEGGSRFVYIGEGIERLLGVPTAAVLASPQAFADRTVPEDRRKVELATAASLADLSIFNCEFRIETTAGELRWLHCRSAPHRQANGTVVWDGVVMDITFRKKAETDLAEREQFLAALFRGCPIGIAVFTPQGTTQRMNPAMRVLMELPGGDDETLQNNALSDLLRDGLAADAFRLALRGDVSSLTEFPLPLTSPNNSPTIERLVWIDCTFFAIRNDSGLIDRVVLFVIDATARVTARIEKQRLEQATQQSQKLDAIGQLAGGIAHDFNNILTGVRVFADLLLDDMKAGDAGHELALEIRKAAERGANLTRRLLSFSRKQIIQPTTLDVNGLILDMSEMLRRLLGETIAIVTELAPDAPAVRADKGQVEQIILNLSLNARDAMPKGGRLNISTARIRKPDQAGDPHQPRAEEFLRLSVTDTGTGMTDDVKNKLFEPFFTTKPVGRGTGLGLATIYGTVRQAGGFITVETQVGQGSGFHVFLPATNLPAHLPESRNNHETLHPVHASILVVDDDPMIRRLADLVLKRAGHQVVTAGSAAEVLAMSETQLRRIELLLTDVVMPGLSGRELVEPLAARYPTLRVGYLSGYTADTVLRHGIHEDGVAFLPKPFSEEQLLEFVTRCLCSSGSQTGPSAL